jgi:hypothetical protein
VGVVQFFEDAYLVFKELWVFDEALVDDFDDPVGVGRLLEFGLVNDAVTSSADGLREAIGTLG